MGSTVHKNICRRRGEKLVFINCGRTRARPLCRFEMLSLLSSSLWTGSWRDVVRGLMLYGVPTAALVSLCGLAAWRYKHRRQEQVSSLQDPSSLQRIPPAAGSGMSETDGGKATRGAGTDHQFSDSGYVESTSFISTSTSTPVLPKQLVDDMRSPDGRYPPPSNSQQQQQPPAQPSEPPVVVAPPSYSTAPVDLRIPRSRATIQLPIDVVGRFIGRQGRNIKSLMAESGSQIHVQQKNLSRDATMVPCVLQGTNPQINKAIDLILLRHPEVVIPPIPTVFSQLPPSPINPVVDITTNSSDGTHPIPPVNQLTAAETNWDYTLKPHVIPDSPFLAIATYIEKLNRIWLVPYSSTQQLDELHQAMTLAYSKRKVHPPPPSSLDSGVSIPTNDLPPEDIVGKYCAVRVSEVYWLRGRVNTMRCDEGTDYEVKLMDYGSSVIVPPTAIKPLRYSVLVVSMLSWLCNMCS